MRLTHSFPFVTFNVWIKNCGDSVALVKKRFFVKRPIFVVAFPLATKNASITFFARFTASKDISPARDTKMPLPSTKWLQATRNL